MTDTQPKLSNQWFYERTLAPKIAHIAQLAEKRGMALSVLVEVMPGDIHRHQLQAQTVSLSMAVAQMAAVHLHNIDQLVLAVARVLDQNGVAHQSAVLQMVGLHPDPTQRGRTQTVEAIDTPAESAAAGEEASADE
jgi:hypothetical protein